MAKRRSIQIITSDASAFKAAVRCLYTDEVKDLTFNFNKHEMAQASGIRELLAVKKFLAHVAATKMEMKKNLFCGALIQKMRLVF